MVELSSAAPTSAFKFGLVGAHARLDRLDQLRFAAGFIVIAWHGAHGMPSTLFGAGNPFGFLAQGHTGVSFFCVISGFIFAWLYFEKPIRYAEFMRKRVLRIVPLFLFWVALSFYTSTWELADLVLTLGTMLARKGLPSLVAQGWSVLIEMQFYLLFPFLIAFARQRGIRYLLSLVGLLLAVRGLMWVQRGYVQDLSYWSLFGRMDQFLLGMCAAIFLKRYQGGLRPLQIAGWLGVALIVVVYGYYNAKGGFYAFGGGKYPSTSPLFVFLPTLEAVGYTAIVLGYVSMRPSRGFVAGLVGGVCSALGRLSYSMYLSHLLVFTALAQLMPSALVSTSWEMSMIFVCFILLPAVAAFSSVTYFLIEKPFIDLKR